MNDTTVNDTIVHRVSEIPKSRHPLAGLLFSQFIGAFNDNAWKLMVFTLATRSLILDGIPSVTFEYESQMKATVALLVFLIPMLLFSLPAGAIADRNSKRSMIIWMKVLEVILMALATLTIFLAPNQLFLPYFLLAMMGMQSAFFSPAKYGILPQILPYEKLSRGNGLIEMLSMLAIIGGTGLGPLMLAADKSGAKPWLTWTGPAILCALSFAGLLASFAVPKVEAARAKGTTVITTIKDSLTAITSDRVLLMAILGNILYWLIMSLLGQNVLVYAKGLVKFLEKGELFQGIPPASYGLGIAIGALFGGRLSGDRIEYGLIPFGAIGFAAMSLLLGVLQPAMPGTVVILILMGISSGMLIVPLKSIVQWRAPKEQRGAVIATGNVFDIFGMIVGSLAAAAMAWIGLDLGLTLIASAIIVVIATVWSVRLLPEALTRLVFIILTTTFYRIRIKGRNNIPKEGGALLVSNHLSATDAFFLMASIDRPVRFIMSETNYNKWWLRPFAMAMDAIPVPYSGKPVAIKKALRLAGKQLRRGHLVCIFPEGQVSRTGLMQPFKEGVEDIIEGQNCPIIPVNIDRVWGTIFSPKGGRYTPKRPQNIPHSLSVSFGEPLPPETSFTVIRKKIRELWCDAWLLRKEDEVATHLHFIRSVWRAPWKMALADEKIKSLSRLRVLTLAITLGRKLRNRWKDDDTVMIIIPPSILAVVTNLAATIGGKIVINYNWTSDAENLKFCLEEAKVRTILTTREFIAKIGLEIPQGHQVIFLEDIEKTITPKNNTLSAIMGLLSPTYLLEKACGAKRAITIDDVLTIIFTSGSTDKPKGVILSHFNVSSNVEAVAQVVPTTSKKDKLLHTLPLSHSFGYMTMWLGLNNGIPLVMHPNPLDAAGIGKIIKEQKVTILWTTPSFLKTYIPQVTPDMFGALRFVLTGAEKLSPKLCEDFKERFGIYPVEGYGTTECSPVIATSTLDVRLPGVYQAGSVKGSVGQPLPGVLTKIVDPTTFEELPPNTPGLLLVKGPNIMRGYLNRLDLTEKVMHGEWYITGDIALIDENDYIMIIDRLSRFAKIGGEMVSHAYIENALQLAAQRDDQVFAVTSIRSEDKGEQLFVLHTLEEGRIPEVIRGLSEQGLPNLFIPRPNYFIRVEELPILGTGKIDLKAVRTIATEHSLKVNA